MVEFLTLLLTMYWNGLRLCPLMSYKLHCYYNPATTYVSYSCFIWYTFSVNYRQYYYSWFALRRHDTLIGLLVSFIRWWWGNISPLFYALSLPLQISHILYIPCFAKHLISVTGHRRFLSTPVLFVLAMHKTPNGLHCNVLGFIFGI